MDITKPYSHVVPILFDKHFITQVPSKGTGLYGSVNGQPLIRQDHAMLNILASDLDWVHHDKVPRREYYCNEHNVPYTYGKGRGVRQYQPQPWHPLIVEIKREIEYLLKCSFDVCFLNYYLDARDHLGWHADDSPEMDHNSPIAIVSLGPIVSSDAEDRARYNGGVPRRTIMFAPQTDLKDVTTVPLESGSLLVMLPGMQRTHYHRIPKASFECGPRISLTFRKYIDPKDQYDKVDQQ